MSNFKCQISNWKLEIGSIGNSWRSQAGITSLSALIIVLLIVIIAWQGGKYIDNYFEQINLANKAAQDADERYDPNCTGPSCDTDEGAGELPPIYTPPADIEVFSWQDDGRP